MNAGPASSPTVERVLRLQRTAGNAAVGRWLARAEVSDIEIPTAVNHTHGGVLQDDHALAHIRHKGVPFVRGAGEDASGVDAGDIRQGFIGDCFFLSPLMAAARINPGKIAHMVRGPIGESAGNSVYEVKLYDAAGDLVTHHIDDRFVSTAAGDPRYAQYGDMSALGPELWVMLMEKAWAAQRGGFNNMDFGLASDGLRAVTGKSSSWHNVGTESTDQIIANISQAVADGKPVVCNTPGTITGPALAWAAAAGISLVSGHSYNVASANATARTIDVANPHGRNHLPGLAVGNFRMIFEWYGILDASVR
jgi:Calpain family cysteine protease